MGKTTTRLVEKYFPNKTEAEAFAEAKKTKAYLTHSGWCVSYQEALPNPDLAKMMQGQQPEKPKVSPGFHLEEIKKRIALLEEDPNRPLNARLRLSQDELRHYLEQMKIPGESWKAQSLRRFLRV